MGDTPAPASKRKDSSASTSAPLPESQTKLNQAMSTAPPTDDIDSEWPSDDEPAFEPKVEALQKVASATPEPSRPTSDGPPWQETDEGAKALTAPRFPSDPGLPRDLRSPSSVPSSRPALAVEAPPPSKRDMDTVPAAPQASRPPNSSGVSSSRVRASADAVDAAEAMAVSARLRASQSITEAAPPSAPAPTAQARFESSPAPVVTLPSQGPESRRDPSADARHSFDPHVHLSQPVEARKPSRAPLLFALVASAAAAVLLMQAGGGSTSSTTSSAASSAVSNSAPPVAEAPSAHVANAEPKPEGKAEPAKSEAKEELPKPEPAKPEQPSAAPASAAVVEAPKAEAETTATASPASTGNISVLIRVKPPQARIFYRGKEVGKPPVTVEIEPGKRRAYEVSLPGFMTRKVVVDGSETELSIGLRPDPSAPAPK
ncbi:MAG TPA: hypothetical protein VFQ35_28675 [Polyangiaceae bacterium]|nr:hypothetical protein [Polyangiaceae bacterium]